MKRWRDIRPASVLEGTIIIVLVLLAWEIFPRMGLVDARSLPPFSQVIAGLGRLIISGVLLENLLVSLQRAFAGFALAVAVALPLGMLVGWFPRVERILDPLLQVCRNTTVLALYPVFLLFFGLGESSKLALILWTAVWPILINTIEGVKATDPLLVKSARSMGASHPTMFLRVIFPSALPLILTGFRLGAARSLVVLVLVEMFGGGSGSGLGYLIYHSQDLLEIPEMYASIISISLLGLLVNYLLVALQKRLTKWKEQAGQS